MKWYQRNTKDAVVHALQNRWDMSWRDFKKVVYHKDITIPVQCSCTFYLAHSLLVNKAITRRDVPCNAWEYRFMLDQIPKVRAFGSTLRYTEGQEKIYNNIWEKLEPAVQLIRKKVWT